MHYLVYQYQILLQLCAHTHSLIHYFVGISIDVVYIDRCFFLQSKLYILSPYTNPKLTYTLKNAGLF